MRAAVTIAAAVLALLAGSPSAARAQGPPCNGATSPNLPPPKPGGAPLHFGIYPGGEAGQAVGPPAAPDPEDAAAQAAAVDALRGDPRRPYGIHLYLSFTGAADQPERVRRAVELVDRWGAGGYDVEYVLAYRPVARRGEPDVAAFVAFVREMVRTLGSRRGLTSIQVMNEVNNTASPDASDGAFPGARDALVRGMIAAREEATRAKLDHLELGFNWFYRLDPETERSFWSELGRKGGKPFAEAVDWIGLDAYPGTFFPPTASEGTFGSAMVNAMSLLRECLAPLAGIGPGTPMHVIENGYPTGPGRSYAQQALALDEMVRAVHRYRVNYGVTAYNLFDLRDGDTESQNFQQQFGITTDRYAPKPAFALYRGLAEQLGVGPAAPAGGPPAPGAAPARVGPRVAVTVSPRRDRRAQYVVRTRGRVVAPPGVPPAGACAGRVTVQVKAGRRTLSTRRARVAPACTFASAVTFRAARRVGSARALRVLVRFGGSERLLPARGPVRRVALSRRAGAP